MLVLVALVVLCVVPDQYVVRQTSFGSTLGIVQTKRSDKVGNSFVVEEQGSQSYLHYRPNKTMGFAIMEREGVLQ